MIITPKYNNDIEEQKKKKKTAVNDYESHQRGK